MPIYEYRCARCGADFELLVGVASGGSRPARRIACPECSSARVRRRLSTFAVGRAADGGGSRSTGQSSGRSSCSGCAGGNCSHCH